MGFSGKLPSYYVFENDTIYFAINHNAVNRAQIINYRKLLNIQQRELFNDTITNCNYDTDCEYAALDLRSPLPIFFTYHISILKPGYFVYYPSTPDRVCKITGFQTHHSEYSGNLHIFFETDLPLVIPNSGWSIISKRNVALEKFTVLESLQIENDELISNVNDKIVEELKGDPTKLKQIFIGKPGTAFKLPFEEQLTLFITKFRLQLFQISPEIIYSVFSLGDNSPKNILTFDESGFRFYQNERIDNIIRIGDEILFLTTGWKSGTGIVYGEVSVLRNGELVRIFGDGQFSG